MQNNGIVTEGILEEKLIGFKKELREEFMTKQDFKEHKESMGCMFGLVIDKRVLKLETVK